MSNCIPADSEWNSYYIKKEGRQLSQLQNDGDTDLLNSCKTVNGDTRKRRFMQRKAVATNFPYKCSVGSWGNTFFIWILW